LFLHRVELSAQNMLAISAFRATHIQPYCLQLHCAPASEVLATLQAGCLNIGRAKMLQMDGRRSTGSAGVC